MAESVASRELPAALGGGTPCESKTSFLACDMESDSVILKNSDLQQYIYGTSILGTKRFQPVAVSQTDLDS